MELQTDIKTRDTCTRHISLASDDRCKKTLLYTDLHHKYCNENMCYFSLHCLHLLCDFVNFNFVLVHLCRLILATIMTETPYEGTLWRNSK